MQTQIRWNTKELTKDLPEDESGFYKAIGELLPEIEIPNRLHISCHMGDGHAEKVIHGKNGYCGIYVPIKRYQNGSFQTVWYLSSFFNSNISVVKGDTVFLRGYRISDKSYNGFDYLDLTCSDIIGIHNL